MQAAVCRAFKEPLVIEDVAIELPGPGEVAVDLAACAICHSDITYAEGGWAAGCRLSTAMKPPALSARWARASPPSVPATLSSSP